MFLKILILSCVFSINLSYAANRLKVVDKNFVDTEGKVVSLEGINVFGSSKVPPFQMEGSLEALDRIPQLGFNTIRLIFNWEAFEGTKGHYDASYLAYFKSMVTWAEKNQIFVIVDFHQDGFSRYSVYGCGDGFPKWALHQGATVYDPDNGKGCTNWPFWMIANKEMHESWKQFYQNSGKVRDHYLKMVAAVAKELKDFEYVIGYDLLNEPWGNEAKELYPLYEDATAAIRVEDSDAIMFLSPQALTSSGMIQTQLPVPSLKQVVYAPHYYDASVNFMHRWLGYKAKAVFNRMKEIGERWNAPVFIGEYGAPATAAYAKDYIRHIRKMMKKYHFSGAQWVFAPNWNPQTFDGWNLEDFSIVDDRGQLRANFVQF